MDIPEVDNDGLQTIKDQEEQDFLNKYCFAIISSPILYIGLDCLAHLHTFILHTYIEKRQINLSILGEMSAFIKKQI